MTKTAKFLLCENPIADKSDGRIFILHNRTPILLAEVFHFDASDEMAQMDCKRNFSAYGALEYDSEYIVFGCLWMVPDDKFQKKTAQQQADDIAAIMRRMADWYEAYITWEDRQL